MYFVIYTGTYPTKNPNADLLQVIRPRRQKAVHNCLLVLQLGSIK